MKRAGAIGALFSVFCFLVALAPSGSSDPEQPRQVAGIYGFATAPTAGPTPTPTITLSVNPASLTLTAGGSTGTFTATDTNGTGTITAVSGTPSVATVSPASGAAPGPVTFTVTPLVAGSSVITVSDGTRSQPVTVTVNGQLYFQLVKGTNPAPCAYYRLNDSVASPTFNTVMADSSASMSNGNYAPNVPTTTGITANNGGAAAISLPGGAWLNTNEAFGYYNPPVQQPTTGVQVKALMATQTTIQAAAIISYGGNMSAASNPLQYQYMTYQSAGAESTSTVTLNSAGAWQGHGTVPLSTDGGGSVYLVALLNYSDAANGVTVATPSGWTLVTNGSQDNSWIHNRIYTRSLSGSIPANVAFAFSGGVAQANIWVSEVAQTTGADVATGATATVTTPWTTTTGTGTQTGMNDLGLAFFSIGDSIVSLNALNGYTGLGPSLGLHASGGPFGSTAGVVSSNQLITTPAVPSQSDGWSSASGSQPVIGQQVLMAPSSSGGSNPSPYRLSLDAGGHFTFSVNIGGTQHTATSTTTMSRGVIYHVVGTYTGASLYVTVNNSKEGTTSVSGLISGYDTVSSLGVGGTWANDGSTLQFGGVLSDVAIYCGSGGILSDAQITTDYTLSAGAATPAPTPTPTAPPTPSGCPTVPPLVGGTEWAANGTPAPSGTPAPVGFTPFACQTSASPSPWNLPISTNCLAGNCNASYSAATIAIVFANGNDPNNEIRSQEPGHSNVGFNIYYAAASDPLVTFVCVDTVNSCSPANGGVPSTFHIPAQARWDVSDTDNIMVVIQPDGTDLEFYQWNCGGGGCPIGSGAGGNWRTGDVFRIQAGENYGNWVTNSGLVDGPYVSAGGTAYTAGLMRAAELIAGVIPHALRYYADCAGAQGTQYPAHGATTPCTNGGNSGPPLGARFWWDEPRSVMAALAGTSSLTKEELAIFDAWNRYGAYFVDNGAGGQSHARGAGLGPNEGGEMFWAFGNASPFASVPNFVNNLGRCSGPIPGVDTDGGCYVLNTQHTRPDSSWDPWTYPVNHVGTGDALDPLVHAHYLDVCSARNLC